MIDVSAQGGREPRHVPERAGDAWNRMVTVVRCPGALVRPMVPPQLSTSRRAMASPRPDPLEVVENAGSKTRGSTSGAIPSVVLHGEPAPALRDAHHHAPGSRVAGVLEQVDEDFLHFIAPRGGERAGLAQELDRGFG